MANKKASNKAARVERKLLRTQKPERAARLGDRPGVNDAFCAECKIYYDSNNDGQVNKHAH
jgi:hypothetical protein